MALTKYKRDRLDVPHEPGEWIEIKARLSHWELQHAKDVKRAAAQAEMMRAAEALTMVQGAIDKLMDDPAMKEQFEQGMTAKKRDDRSDSGMEAYDEYVLFEHAIVAWSYKGESGEPAAISAESVRDLDTETVDWLQGELASRNIIGRALGEDSAASSQESSSSAA